VKSIKLHFPMKTTTHMIMLGEIERSQTHKLIHLKRRISFFLNSSHFPFFFSPFNIYSLSHTLTLHHQHSSPKLSVKYYLLLADKCQALIDTRTSYQKVQSLCLLTSPHHSLYHVSFMSILTFHS
jgi:hypothetical protein